jgi:glutathione S-transferase
MKLYYSPGACSLASHIVLNEIDADFAIEQVDTATQKTASGTDYGQINPKGVVPAMEIENGEILTEGPAILQWIAEQKPAANLTAKAGTLARTRVQEHLNYIGTELHKAFSPLFSSTATDEQKEAGKRVVAQKMDYVNGVLSDGREYLVDNRFSVADAYLFVVANWSNFTGIDLNRWSHVADFVKRVAAREKVQLALKAEGLLA